MRLQGYREQGSAALSRRHQQSKAAPDPGQDPTSAPPRRRCIHVHPLTCTCTSMLHTHTCRRTWAGPLTTASPAQGGLRCGCAIGSAAWLHRGALQLDSTTTTSSPCVGVPWQRNRGLLSLCMRSTGRPSCACVRARACGCIICL